MGERSVHVAVFCAFYPPAYLGGGPIRTVGALVASAPPEFEVSVVTRRSDLGRKEPMAVAPDRWTIRGRSAVYYTTSESWPRMWRAYRAVHSTNPQIIYVNSFFDFRFSILPQFLSRLGFYRNANMVVAPRGEFGISALSLKSRKKSGFVRAYRLLRMHRRVLWHASNERERRDIVEAMGPDARVIVREDDTELPAAAIATPYRAPGPLRMVSVGRIVPIKGLDLLLTALATVRRPVTLDIFGPLEDERYSAACRSFAKSLPQHVAVAFRGELRHDQVRSKISNYDLMVFPTYGENFGHVVPESLSVSCPVMAADTTPWTSWLKNGAGVLVAPHSAAAWTQAIEHYASLSHDEIQANRQRAGALYGEWRKATSTTDHAFVLFQQ